MTALQVVSVSSSDHIDRPIYPAEIYQIADAGCRYRVDSKNEDERTNSLGLTNLVLEVLDREVAQPLAQIPGLVEQVSTGNIDSVTTLKVNEVFNRFPLFVQSLSVGMPGAPLQDVDTIDVAKRAANLLKAKSGNGALLLCGDKPLMGALGIILLRTQHLVPQPLSKEAMFTLLRDMREGSLCHAIKIRVDALLNEISKRILERRERAYARYAQVHAGLEQAQASYAQVHAGLEQAQAEYQDLLRTQQAYSECLGPFLQFCVKNREAIKEKIRRDGTIF